MMDAQQQRQRLLESNRELQQGLQTVSMIYDILQAICHEYPDGTNGITKSMRFDFIQRRHCREWPVNLMCQALNVSEAGYYKYLRRQEDDFT